MPDYQTVGRYERKEGRGGRSTVVVHQAVQKGFPLVKFQRSSMVEYSGIRINKINLLLTIIVWNKCGILAIQLQEDLNDVRW